MKKILSAVLGILMLFSPITIFSQDELSKELILGTFESAAIYKDGLPIWSSGENTSLPIGSVSKTFTAAMIMILSDRGKISLDKPVTFYLNDFKMADERYNDITVRMLLDHSSGIYGSTLKASMLYGKYDSWNHDNILSVLSEQKLKYAPGTMSNYCNDGYTLLELILERVTDKSYTELLSEMISKPLDLKNTVTSKEYNGSCDDYVSALGTGGIFSSADELCIFGYNLLKSDGLLQANSAVSMTESGGASLDEGRFDFGLGFDDVSVYPFDEHKIKACAKDGDTLSYSTSLVVIPSLGICAAVIAKDSSSVFCRTGAIKLIMNYINENSLGSVKWIDFPGYEKKDVSDMVQYSKYSGFYASNKGQYIFYEENGKWFLNELYTGKSTAYEYIGEGKFSNANEYLSFEKINGAIYLIKEGTTYLNADDRFIYRYYFAEKKEHYAVNYDAWNNRNRKSYFICDEPYDSQLYLTSIPLSNVYFDKNFPGFLSYMKIINDSDAVSDIAIPGSFGRDLTDIHIYEENGIEYLNAQGWTFIDSTKIPEIYDGAASIATVGENGYTKWYLIKDAAGKSIRAEKNGNGMYAVYSADGKCMYSSLISKDAFTLPQGGYIAFSGDPKVQFQITLN